MAISQVTKGVFVISPDQQKRYQDTAAGQYTSVFTKNRADQWEMAQKEAARQAGLAADVFQYQMKLYEQQIKDQQKQIADLDKMALQVQNGEIKAKDAATALGIKVEQFNAAQENRRAEIAAATAATSTGSVTTGGGGARRGAGPDAVSTKAQEQINLSKGVVDPANAAGLANDVAQKMTDPRIGVGTPSESLAVRYRTVNESIDANAAALMSSDPTMTYADARDIAEINVKDSLTKGGRKDFADAYDQVDTKIKTEIGTPTVTSRTVEFYKTHPNLGPAATVDVTKAGEVPATADRKALLDAIKAKQEEIAGKKFELPTVPVGDNITLARQIMAGRFGPTPASAAFEQRNALQYLQNAPKDVVQAAYQEYLKTLPPPAAATPTAAPTTAPAPALTPMQKQQADVAAARGAGILGPNPELDALLGTPVPSAEGLRPPVVQESLASRMFRERSPTFGQGGTAEAAPPIGINVPPPPEMGTKPEPVDAETERKRRTLGDILLRGFKPEYDRTTGQLIVPQLTGPERAEAIQGIDMQKQGLQSRFFPESMLPPYPREVNGQSFRPLSYAETQNVNYDKEKRYDPGEDFLNAQRIQLEAMFPEGIPPQFTAKLAPPPATPAPRLPTMTPPTIQAEPIPSPARMSPVPPPESLGEKPTGEIPVYPAAPGMAPAAERPPLKAPRPAGPKDVVGNAENAMGAAKKLSDIKAAAKAGIGGETAGVGAKKNPTAETYLFYRMETALDLVKKDDKLRRLVASGPGKIANDLYIANKSKGVPFNKTWEEITMTFNQDKEAMAKAHEVALALDMKATDQKTPKE